VLRVLEPSERVVPAGAPLVEVGNPGGLEVVVDVLSQDAARIAPGNPVTLTDWGGDSALAGRVRLVETAAFTKVSALGVEEQRVNVVADLDAPPAALGVGYRVEARIVTSAGAGMLQVPASALFRQGDTWHVFRVEGGRARLAPVRLGRRNEQAAEVLDGLAEGDRVVRFPSERVADGTRVRDAGPR
jgi:HlyD family secretion protein